MILVYDITSTMHSIILSIIVSWYLLFLESQCKMYKIYLSLIFIVIRVMIQYHIMILLSPLSSLIDAPRQVFCQHGMHDTIYNTPIVASLMHMILVNHTTPTNLNA
jgi:hypothetical protein